MADKWSLLPKTLPEFEVAEQTMPLAVSRRLWSTEDMHMRPDSTRLSHMDNEVKGNHSIASGKAAVFVGAVGHLIIGRWT